MKLEADSPEKDKSWVKDKKEQCIALFGIGKRAIQILETRRSHIRRSEYGKLILIQRAKIYIKRDGDNLYKGIYMQ